MKRNPLWLLPPLAVGAVMSAPAVSGAFSPNNIRVGFPGGDWMTNYDYHSTDSTEAHTERRLAREHDLD